MIGGTTNEDHKRVVVVDENNYETVRSSFKDVFIDQIYSIQKSSEISWDVIFNIDDFLYSKNRVETNGMTNNVQVKTEVNVSPKKVRS